MPPVYTFKDLHVGDRFSVADDYKFVYVKIDPNVNPPYNARLWRHRDERPDKDCLVLPSEVEVYLR